MNTQVLLLVMLSLFVAGFVCGGIFAGFRWGQFAATRASHDHASKWKAYLVSLLPPAAFSLSFHFDSMLSPLAGKAFFALAVASMLGVFLRWHSRRFTSDSGPNPLVD
jgi:hypothetical protein